MFWPLCYGVPHFQLELQININWVYFKWCFDLKSTGMKWREIWISGIWILTVFLLDLNRINSEKLVAQIERQFKARVVNVEDLQVEPVVQHGKGAVRTPHHGDVVLVEAGQDGGLPVHPSVPTFGGIFQVPEKKILLEFFLGYKYRRIRVLVWDFSTNQKSKLLITYTNQVKSQILGMNKI